MSKALSITPAGNVENSVDNCVDNLRQEFSTGFSTAFRQPFRHPETPDPTRGNSLPHGGFRHGRLLLLRENKRR